MTRTLLLFSIFLFTCAFRVRDLKPRKTDTSIPIQKSENAKIPSLKSGDVKKDSVEVNVGVNGLAGLSALMLTRSKLLGTNLFESEQTQRLFSSPSLPEGPTIGRWQTHTGNEVKLFVMPALTEKDPFSLGATIHF